MDEKTYTNLAELAIDYIKLKRESMLPCKVKIEYKITEQGITRHYENNSIDQILSFSDSYLAINILNARINKFLDDKKKSEKKEIPNETESVSDWPTMESQNV